MKKIFLLLLIVTNYSIFSVPNPQTDLLLGTKNLSEQINSLPKNSENSRDLLNKMKILREYMSLLDKKIDVYWDSVESHLKHGEELSKVIKFERMQYNARKHSKADLAVSDPSELGNGSPESVQKIEDMKNYKNWWLAKNVDTNLLKECFDYLARTEQLSIKGFSLDSVWSALVDINWGLDSTVMFLVKRDSLEDLNFRLNPEYALAGLPFVDYQQEDLKQYDSYLADSSSSIDLKTIDEKFNELLKHKEDLSKSIIAYNMQINEFNSKVNEFNNQKEEAINKIVSHNKKIADLEKELKAYLKNKKNRSPYKSWKMYVKMIDYKMEAWSNYISARDFDMKAREFMPDEKQMDIKRNELSARKSELLKLEKEYSKLRSQILYKNGTNDK